MLRILVKVPYHGPNKQCVEILALFFIMTVHGWVFFTFNLMSYLFSTIVVRSSVSFAYAAARAVSGSDVDESLSTARNYWRHFRVYLKLLNRRISIHIEWILIIVFNNLPLPIVLSIQKDVEKVDYVGKVSFVSWFQDLITQSKSF